MKEVVFNIYTLLDCGNSKNIRNYNKNLYKKLLNCFYGSNKHAIIMSEGLSHVYLQFNFLTYYKENMLLSKLNSQLTILSISIFLT